MHDCAGKAVGAVAGQRGLCRSYMRVNYKEEEMKGEHLPVVAIPTSHA
jgi:alcohol dehydrogenase class IV